MIIRNSRRIYLHNTYLLLNAPDITLLIRNIVLNKFGKVPSLMECPRKGIGIKRTISDDFWQWQCYKDHEAGWRLKFPGRKFTWTVSDCLPTKPWYERGRSQLWWSRVGRSRWKKNVRKRVLSRNERGILEKEGRWQTMKSEPVKVLLVLCERRPLELCTAPPCSETGRRHLWRLRFWCTPTVYVSRETTGKFKYRSYSFYQSLRWFIWRQWGWGEWAREANVTEFL